MPIGYKEFLANDRIGKGFNEEERDFLKDFSAKLFDVGSRLYNGDDTEETNKNEQERELGDEIQELTSRIDVYAGLTSENASDFYEENWEGITDNVAKVGKMLAEGNAFAILMADGTKIKNTEFGRDGADFFRFPELTQSKLNVDMKARELKEKYALTKQEKEAAKEEPAPEAKLIDRSINALKRRARLKDGYGKSVKLESSDNNKDIAKFTHEAAKRFNSVTIKAPDSAGKKADDLLLLVSMGAVIDKKENDLSGNLTASNAGGLAISLKVFNANFLLDNYINTGDRQRGFSDILANSREGADKALGDFDKDPSAAIRYIRNVVDFVKRDLAHPDVNRNTDHGEKEL